MTKENLISKIEKCVGTYSNSLTRCIAEEVYEKVVKPYEDFIEQINGELDETQNGHDVVISSIKDMIETFNK